jgi:HK97 family phage major capsid protein/HK97 family phage prohead protease
MHKRAPINRAYSLLEIKSVDELEQQPRSIRGVATTPTPDRFGDIIEPLGIEFAAPLPLLWQHKSDQPVGHVWFDKPTRKGITFRAELAQIDEPGTLRDRLDNAWQHLKANLVRAVSIGFRVLEHEPIDPKDPWGAMRFLRSEVLELSLVTIPANADATITQIKSIDEALRAASGREHRAIVYLPGAAGLTPKAKEGSAMRTLADQIKAFQDSKAAKTERMTQIMQKTADDGRSTDEAEQEEFDTLEREVEAIDSDLKRLEALEKVNRSAARPIIAATPERGSEARAGIIQVRQELPKGTAFTRFVMALAQARGNRLEAAEIAKKWHDSTPEVEIVLRAAVAAGTTTDADWAAPLVQYRTMADEFIELLRPATIIGRIPGLRRVPFNVKIPVQTQGSLVNWVGEAQPKPVGELKFVMISLEVNKVAGIVVLSEELVRLSTPSAEAIVRQDLVAQIAQFLDVEFIDPANAAVASVSPASILNGVAGIPSGGTSAADAKADLAALAAAFTTANLGMSTSVYVTTEIIAQQLAALQNPLGQPEFASLQTGDVLNRKVMVTSQAVPAGILAQILPNEILLADDGGVTIDASREATLQMDSAPVAANPATFSLWQNNCVGIRAERWITWRRRRPEAVAYITGANYTGVETP